MLTGLFVPLITPFDREDRVALDALEALADQVLADGATGLVALGTTGEPGALTPAEQRAVLNLTARVAHERGAQLLIGANTPEALRDAAGRGATAALTLVPPFLRPGEEGVVAYFTKVAAESPVPLVVYDIPYRTGQHLSAATLRRLAALPNVIGVKHAPGGVTEDTVDLMVDPPAGFAVLGGEDAFLSPLLALGGHGGILASAHVATGRFVELVQAWEKGDTTTIRALTGPLSALSRALFAEPNPTVVKGVLHAQGRIPTAEVRLPLLPASPANVEEAVRRATALS
ncbi:MULTISPECIES: dihydrodipicolinate synthase family protein [unclassified Saccharothrix]|uniref:dihydrodipicolinate synthase family protein n=1 Tax=unclassified Saccharothrix TaxID=2593673 RepID=UPI00307F3756